MEDFNATVGESGTEPVVGNYGLGDRDDVGQRCVDFCMEFKLFTSNTMFKRHPPLHLETGRRCITSAVGLLSCGATMEKGNLQR
jgi:hypothetical protein